MTRRPAVDALRRAVRGARAWVSTPGALPGFLVIGGQRCGTTSLHSYLAAHPQVRAASGKELQYFSLHYGRGERWYRGHFPPASPGTVCFEASPLYLFHPLAPGRAAATLPSGRYVALLRDPVERAWSHYLHTRSYGQEPLDFADALAAEPSRTASPEGLRRYSYAARGRYAEQLERWFAHVPRERLHVVRSEDLYADPAAVYAKVLAFLGLDPFTPAAFAVHTRRVDHSGPPPDVARRLRAEFAPHNDRLAELLGWSRTWPSG
ncbi:sulfotransferase family protein [Phytohabitans suffuscus]|uniref:Deacetylase sulfotransferase n=1 Tax=Phytohabitans suffuscus TaxID=624315 RepID=A0A6F8YXJ8_9ACTN|nr:sulfotransferase [Phytohabitans suffuscus]BCB90822.1 deacetylase sulfotransferase [Phytohabitans suffuscus]